MYREGEYSIQVDILILSWRLWENTHYPPPPDNPMLHQPSPVHSNQQNNPTASLHRSSSSSSNDAPSEPTIDYSSWSPRSYRMERKCTSNWKIKVSDSTKISNKTSSHTMSTPLTAQLYLSVLPHPSRNLPPILSQYQSQSSGGTLLFPPPLPNISHNAWSPTPMIRISTPPPPLQPRLSLSVALPLITLISSGRVTQVFSFPATENPIRLHEARSTYPPRTHLLSSPHPILINPPSLLTETTGHHTSREAREQTTTPPAHAISLVPPTTSFPLSLSMLYLPPIQMILRAFISEYIKATGGPSWPKRINHTKQSSYIQAHPEIMSQVGPQTRHNLTPLGSPLSSPPSNITPDYHPLDEIRYPLQSSHDDLFPMDHIDVTHYPLQNPHNDLCLMAPTQNDPSVQTCTKMDTHVSTLNPICPKSLTSPPTQKMAKQGKRDKEKEKGKGKGKQQFLRRSTRLQAKHRSANDTAKRFSGAQTAKIAFDFNAQESPLDATSTLTILHATGLQINKSVQDAIEEALKKDSPTDAIDRAPTTPLHDPIPPLAVPGFDLPL